MPTNSLKLKSLSNPLLHRTPLPTARRSSVPSLADQRAKSVAPKCMQPTTPRTPPPGFRGFFFRALFPAIRRRITIAAGWCCCCCCCRSAFRRHRRPGETLLYIYKALAPASWPSRAQSVPAVHETTRVHRRNEPSSIAKNRGVKTGKFP